jgi:glycosyltransferase involved in cell wall biosynthesis
MSSAADVYEIIMGLETSAPDIGGISTLIVENNGYLMSSAADVYEIIMGLETIFSLQDVNSYRNSARNIIDRKFNAEKNYKAFISQAEKMIENE